MIRVTQSYLIDLAMKFFKRKQWEPLYYDMPGGRRSGVGMVGKINEVWESTYNLSPDLLLLNNKTLLLLEVDDHLSEVYITKFRKYQTKSDEVIKKLSTILNRQIDELNFGFVSKLKRLKIDIPNDLPNFLFVYYQSGELKERTFNPS